MEDIETRNYYFFNDQPESLTPDIIRLFQFYDSYFFSDVLEASEVKWSKRMTLCAGTCKHSAPNSCVITLSESILQFRNSNELKETLLHEMIHGYLFLTNPKACLEDGGHGKEFKDMMKFINEVTQLNITIYHSFQDEVESFRRHIWKCDGPCSKQPPYFGIVKRAVNRKPQQSDPWFSEHQSKCGGTFIKIQEPEQVQKPKAAPKKSHHSESPMSQTESQQGTRKSSSSIKQESLFKFFEKQQKPSQPLQEIPAPKTNSIQSESSVYNLSKIPEKPQCSNQQRTSSSSFLQSSQKQSFDILAVNTLSSNETTTTTITTTTTQKASTMSQTSISNKESQNKEVQVNQVKIFISFTRDPTLSKNDYYLYWINSEWNLLEISEFIKSILPNLKCDGVRNIILESSLSSDERLSNFQELRLGQFGAISKLLFDFGNVKVSLHSQKYAILPCNQNKPVLLTRFVSSNS